MRPFTSDQLEIATYHKPRGEHLKVEVKDGGGTWRDLSSYPGFDAVISANWGEDVDSPGQTAEVELVRNVNSFSVSPFLEDAPANVGFVFGGTYSPLVDANRELRISVAVVSDLRTPGVSDWIEVFHGRIWAIEGAEPMRLQVRDLSGDLTDAFLKYEYVVGMAPVALRVFEPSRNYVVGEYILPTEGNRNGKYFQVTTGGTSAPSEPTWPTSSTVTSGSVTFTTAGSVDMTTGRPIEDVIQDLLNAAGFGSVTVAVPSSPGWAVRPYVVNRQPLMEAIKTLAQQTGWLLRYKWDTGSGTFKLTLYEPDRNKATIDWTFSARDYEKVDSFALDTSGIRNDVRIVFSDETDKDSTGAPKRKSYEVEDGASVTRYGRRFFEAAEASTSQVDTLSRATALGDNVLKDLKDPLADCRLVLFQGFPWMELGDRLEFVADGSNFDANQVLSVVSFRHRAEGGRLATEISCRGQPCGGYAGWHAISTRANPITSQRLTLANALGGLTVTAAPVVGGIRILVSGDPNRVAQAAEYEFHVSSSNGFTPDSSTLKGQSAARSFEVANLTPGATYYVRVVPLSRTSGGGLVRGEPTAQQSVVAGQAYSAHLSSDPEWGRIPLNGGFETQFDAAVAPDHWTVTQGLWGTHWSILSDSSGISGDRYLKHNGVPLAGVAPTIASDWFQVEAGAYYDLSFWSKRLSGATTALVAIIWADKDKSAVGFNTAAITTNAAWTFTKFSDATSGNQFRQAPATARFARIEIQSAILDSSQWVVDQVRLEKYFRPQAAWLVQAVGSNPALYGGFTDNGGGAPAVAWKIDANGRVALRGTVNTNGLGITGTAFLTLPAGYRPVGAQFFPVPYNGAMAYVAITAAGVLTINHATGIPAGLFSLDSISFDTL